MARKRSTDKRPSMRVDCPVCELVEVDVEQANVLLRNTGVGNALLFRCPKCLDMIELEGLNKPMTATLLAAGVVLIDQMVECLAYPSRPALTEQDIEAFVKGIEHVRYLASHARRECDRYRRELLDAQ